MADDRFLTRNEAGDPKASSPELRQQWVQMNVRASSRTFNRRLNSAGLEARCPRRRPCLTLDHVRNLGSIPGPATYFRFSFR